MGFHAVLHFDYRGEAWLRVLGSALSLNGEGGSAGVRFFFVLSGFLIAFLMNDEERETGRVAIFRFYARRALRIWPLYYTVLVFGFIGYPALMEALGRTFQGTADPLLYAAFLTNFDHIWNAMPNLGILGVQWSVAIEEQFYFVWPLVFAAFVGRRVFPWLLLGSMAASFSYRAAFADTFPALQFHTLSATGDLSLGALAAHICFTKADSVRAAFALLSRGTIQALYALGLGFILIKKYLVTSQFTFALGEQASSFVFAFVILEQTYAPHSFYKGERSSFATHLGRISYGLYLWHMVAITAMQVLAPYVSLGVLVQTVGAVVLTWGLAEASHRWIESPFLRLKGRLGASTPSSDDASERSDKGRTA